ncbi:DNA-binding transcriptional activator of the SARP family [Lentzea albidocapillata subsp. violacea]|uniref:DNA-binding transcriptional activator of the SARP family n=1 Tax=Lentzea albidocapillata subsp. violacea TaxID=128104 RepID=A0A1G9YTE7_9PSEU|nr:BTAD domain-containing putative transcriptional regulator [Lentzea albidocapillata]SDN12394.1 DNA-binding transcriptional activator of the SARP family [Lentzea albidocapillata subsp. violacea]
MTVVNLLGEVTVQIDGRQAELGHGRQRCVLAALAVDAGRVVPDDRLMNRIWASEVPARAQKTLYSYVSRLRKMLAAEQIVRRPGGYVLAEADTDLRRFRELCVRARQSTDAERTELLTEALALWRGDALTGLPGEWAQAERDRLHLERLAAEQDLVDARLRTGQTDGLLAVLSDRAEAHPLDERIAGQYMRALAAAGRAADALAYYLVIRDRLVEEHGTEPGAVLQEVHREVLAGAGQVVPEPVVVPRQLPGVPASFVGRHDALERLGDQPRIFAIAGPGGIGKTWLALHWAHRNAACFPDGQLFVDLRGFAPEAAPMPPKIALRGFLHALGVDRCPADLHAQTALFRSLVVDRQMLLVLDNAADTAQVVPLLPGGESCTVVVTSRRRLPGLIAGHGARHIALDRLPPRESRALLTDRLGSARIAADPAAVDELIVRCDGFPLALSIVAGDALAHPEMPLARFTEDLCELGPVALDGDESEACLTAVLSWSLRCLTPEQVQAFVLLGVAPGSDIGLAAAADLFGLTAAAARAVLNRLETLSLLTQDARGRYRMHDLIRGHAAVHEIDEETRLEALRRVVDHYTRTAIEADRLIDPSHALDLFPAESSRLSSVEEAITWFRTEHANLLAAHHIATTRGWHLLGWGLTWSLQTLLARRSPIWDRHAVLLAATESVEQLADPALPVVFVWTLGNVCADLGLREDTDRYLSHALELAEELQDSLQQAHVHRVSARAAALRGDDERALAHSVKSLELFRLVGVPAWTAGAANNVGWFAALTGDLDTAREHCEAAITMFEELGDLYGEANTLDSLGWIAHRSGDHLGAADKLRRAATLLRSTSGILETANSLAKLGDPLMALGRSDEARAAWQEAAELYRAQHCAEDAYLMELKLSGREFARQRSAPRD